MICQKSKKLEDACYVAKDIVDLFRIFAEGEKLNATPIGKLSNFSAQRIVATHEVFRRNGVL